MARRQSRGEMPQNRRNCDEKWAVEEYPSVRAMEEMAMSLFSSSSRAFWMRQCTMNAAGGNPVWCLKVEAKRLSHLPIFRAMSSTVYLRSGCLRMSATSCASGDETARACSRWDAPCNISERRCRMSVRKTNVRYVPCGKVSSVSNMDLNRCFICTSARNIGRRIAMRLRRNSCASDGGKPNARAASRAEGISNKSQ